MLLDLKEKANQCIYSFFQQPIALLRGQSNGQKIVIDHKCAVVSYNYFN